jgi:hypothetical protein
MRLEKYFNTCCVEFCKVVEVIWEQCRDLEVCVERKNSPSITKVTDRENYEKGSNG